MDSRTFHREMMVSGNYIAAAHARALSADSRRWLEEYRARNRRTVKAIPMSCLLCDAQQEEMHHLSFRVTALDGFAAANPDYDLKSELSKFGVCKDCFAKYQGSQRRVVFDLNRVLHAHDLSPRVLH